MYVCCLIVYLFVCLSLITLSLSPSEVTWSVWSGCSTSCDGGVRIRSYRCRPNQLFFDECVESGIETQEQTACNLQPCPSTTFHTTTTANAETTSSTTPEPVQRPDHGYTVLDSIPYSVLTNTFAPTVTVTPLGQLMISTATTSTTTPAPPSPTTATISTTTAKTRMVVMHPLYPTTIISPPIQSYNNTEATAYQDSMHHKPTEKDTDEDSISLWHDKQVRQGIA